MRRLILPTLILLTFSACKSTRSDLADPPPNIVIILADDLGYGSVGAYGANKNVVLTPSIDRLAREGRRFTNAYTPSSVCSPTRYGLLTGRYDWRTGKEYGVLGSRESIVLTSFEGITSLRKGDWKYIEGVVPDPNPKWLTGKRLEEANEMLYNLSRDPGEQNNVIPHHPDIADEMRSLLSRIRIQGYSRTR